MKTKLSERLENGITCYEADNRRLFFSLDELQAQILQDLEDMAVKCSRVAVPEGVEGHIVKAVPLENLRKYCEVEK